jgi:long-chain acyl-CoA synthetase
MNQTMIELERLTLKHLFERSVRHYGDNIALTKIGQTPLRYSDLKREVEKCQLLMQSHGIKAGDKVALFSENMPNWGVIYFAVTTMGAVIVPILPDFHASEARHIIRHAECSAAFVSKRLLEDLEGECASSLSLVVLTDDLSVVEKLTPSDRVTAVLKKGEAKLNRIRKNAMELAKIKESIKEPDEDDLAAVIYTSGTTGSSKGVMLTHRNLTFETLAAQTIVDISPKDRFLSILPLAHTYECTIGFLIPMLNGSAVYYIDKVPTPRILVDAMSKVRPTFMLSVPLIIEKIYKNRIQPNFEKNILIRALYSVPFIRRSFNRIAGRKLMETFGGELRFFGIGGAALAPHVEQFLIEARFPYAIGYGLTETAPLLAGTGPEKTRFRSVGRPLEGVELKLVNRSADGEGEIWARGPNVMKGYYKDPEKTKAVLDEEGWFHTEDLGHFNKDGFLYISGRSKNVIIGPGGENIYPEQIEALINEYEIVADALVYENEGRLCARVHLDYEKLDEKMGIKKMSETKVHAKVEELLESMRTDLNTKVSSFSRVMKFIEQREPFVKTPTKKIKRYLYVKPK